MTAHNTAPVIEEEQEQTRPLVPGPELPAPRYRLLSGEDVRALPPLRWLVKGVLPAEGVAAIYGPSASGKSFLALDMATAIAEGREWFGFSVAPAPVVFVTLEGEAGLRGRVLAWESFHGRALPDDMRATIQPFYLAEGQETGHEDIAALSAVVPKGAVIFIDTLNRAAPFSDENSSRDMGAILVGSKALQKQTGGLVVLVHHTGKDTGKGMRGHTSLFAALDAVVEVTRDNDRRGWKLAKAKDGEDGRAHPFRLEVVELGRDEDGDPVTSCAVVSDDTGEGVARVKLPQGGNQKIIFDALRPILSAQAPFNVDYPACVPAGRVAVELEAVLPKLAGCLTCPSDKRTSRARDSVTGLINRGIYEFRDGWLWRK